MILSSRKGNKPYLLGLNIHQLEDFAKCNGQDAFRGRQIHEWLYKKGVKSLDQITVLPKAWRYQLIQEGFSAGRLREASRYLSNDGTLKLLLETVDNEIIEAVGIPTRDRLTVCISSQIGCPMQCRFCATGKSGFQRSLEVNEIIDQILSLREVLNRRPSNIVFMGMGEPLLNIEAVLDSIYCMNKDLEIGQRRITLSTVGILNTLPQLAELARERLGKVQFTLALSLHAPNQGLRESIIPSAKAYPLKTLIEDCRHYLDVTGRRVSFEYILLGDLNDQMEHAEELADLLSGFQSHVNLIAYNPIAEEAFKRPSTFRIKQFMSVLERQGLAVSLRASRGLDQNAACGQLRRQYASFHKGV